jgi:hypothetical protein
LRSQYRRGSFAPESSHTKASAVAASLALNYLIMKIVYLVLFVAMAYLIVDKCCDVIDILPANVMKWVNIQAGGDRSDMDSRVAGIISKGEGDLRQGVGVMSGGKNDKNNDGKDDKPRM